MGRIQCRVEELGSAQFTDAILLYVADVMDESAPRLLKNNPYRALINPIEVLDEGTFEARAQALLYEPRAQRVESKSALLFRSAKLSEPVDRLTSFLQ